MIRTHQRERPHKQAKKTRAIHTSRKSCAPQHLPSTHPLITSTATNTRIEWTVPREQRSSDPHVADVPLVAEPTQTPSPGSSYAAAIASYPPAHSERRDSIHSGKNPSPPRWGRSQEVERRWWQCRKAPLLQLWRWPPAVVVVRSCEPVVSAAASYPQQPTNQSTPVHIHFPLSDSLTYSHACQDIARTWGEYAARRRHRSPTPRTSAQR